MQHKEKSPLLSYSRLGSLFFSSPKWVKVKKDKKWKKNRPNQEKEEEEVQLQEQKTAFPEEKVIKPGVRVRHTYTYCKSVRYNKFLLGRVT